MNSEQHHHAACRKRGRGTRQPGKRLRKWGSCCTSCPLLSYQKENFLRTKGKENVWRPATRSHQTPALFSGARNSSLATTWIRPSRLGVPCISLRQPKAAKPFNPFKLWLLRNFQSDISLCLSVCFFLSLSAPQNHSLKSLFRVSWATSFPSTQLSRRVSPRPGCVSNAENKARNKKLRQVERFCVSGFLGFFF